jgi:hypothetical protein
MGQEDARTEERGRLLDEAGDGIALLSPTDGQHESLRSIGAAGNVDGGPCQRLVYGVYS